MSNSVIVQAAKPAHKLLNSISTQSISTLALNNSSSNTSMNTVIHRPDKAASIKNNEIKKLLEVAENRTNYLSKVYDSSTSDSVHTECSRRSLKPVRHEHERRVDLNRSEPRDYKQIMDKNFLNSSRKLTKVNGKAKFWDEILSGHRHSQDKWNSQFS